MAFVQPESEFQFQFQAFNSSIVGLGSSSNHYSTTTPSSCQGLVSRLLKAPSISTDGLWSLRDELEHNFANRMPYFDRMEPNGILSSVGEGVTELKADFLNENSRSCSPSIDGQSNENIGKGSKIDPKVCGVCGDKALGNNFNAITCESCKAFFRRNALKPKDFVCPFNDNCKVDPVTRRFCQKCRLKKCFDIGMKKEWIMTDDEKKMKKQKIEQNRLKRQSSDAPPCVNDCPMPKSICLLDGLNESNSPTQGPLSTHSEDYHQTESNGAHVSVCPEDPLLIIVPNNNDHPNESKHHLIHQTPTILYDRSYDNSSNSSEEFHPSEEHRRSFSHPNQGPIHSDRRQNGLENSLCSIISNNNAMTQTVPVQKLRHAMNGSTNMWHETIVPNVSPVAKMPVQSGNSNASGHSRPYGIPPDIHPHLNGSNNNELSHTPLLTSLIRPGLAESPPDANLIDCSNSNISPIKSDQGHPSPYSNLHYSEEIGHHSSRKDYLSTGHFHGVGAVSSDNESVPLPLNTMDSILSVAITAEYNSGMLERNSGLQSRELNKAERGKLNELRSASQALHAPVDAEGPFKVTENADPSLINVINLTDIAIRRLIQMSKKIAGFKNMCQEDQIALLKGSCTEMMILRSAVSYDPDRDSWNIPHSSNFGYKINLGVLKEARGNLYEEHQRFVRSFKSIWRADENIMIILCAITLFTPERPNVVHKDVVKLEQDSYLYLLRRYLESTMNGCEAVSTYLQLIGKIAELRELNSNHLRVFLEVNPREVEPLLIEIFDLKQ